MHVYEKDIRYENFPWKKIGSYTERSVLSTVVESQVNRASLLFTQIQNLFIKVKRYGTDYPKFYADFKYRSEIYSDFSVGDIKTRKLFWEKADFLERFHTKKFILMEKIMSK